MRRHASILRELTGLPGNPTNDRTARLQRLPRATHLQRCGAARPRRARGTDSGEGHRRRGPTADRYAEEAARQHPRTGRDLRVDEWAGRASREPRAVSPPGHADQRPGRAGSENKWLLTPRPFPKCVQRYRRRRWLFIPARVTCIARAREASPPPSIPVPRVRARCSVGSLRGVARRQGISSPYGTGLQTRKPAKSRQGVGA
jgi:hypothetical protein